MHQDKTTTANKAFKKLKKAEKRVAIAKDVLKYLKKGKFVAEQKTYVGIPNLDGDMSTCEMFQKAETCKVCGLGALFVAGTLKDCDLIKDDVFTEVIPSYQNVYSKETVPARTEFFQLDDSMREKLGKYFSLDQLETIENAFEGDSTQGRGRGWDFNDGIDQSEKRLTRIMKNIIKNEGTFKP